LVTGIRFYGDQTNMHGLAQQFGRSKIPGGSRRNFVQLGRGEIEEPSFTFDDGVVNMEYLEAAYFAAIEGRRVTLP
jgi:hypothetical protein